MATSSAAGLGDLALTWDVAQANADLSMLDDDLTSDRGLVTAALLSLFLDRRAERDDVPPSGDPQDRRGWWADEFLPVEGDRIGSRMWMLDRSVLTGETVRRAEEYIREALAWMIEDRVVAAVGVLIETTRDGLFYAVTFQRPARDDVTFRFSSVWDAVTP